MKLAELYKKQERTFSFEFFPPKTPEGEEKLFQIAAELKDLKPSFISVTYGAMGTTRENTFRIVTKIKNDLDIEAAAHLTCVGQTPEEFDQIIHDLKEQNIRNLVALRGDPPKGETEFKPVPGGFRYASELVAFIRSHTTGRDNFSIFVAGYPEGHVECKDKEKDMEHLKIKVDAGADAIITQLFFDNKDYFDFVDRARAKGIHVPIVAGIMPVTHGPQIQRFASMCGAKIPAEMENSILKFGDDQQSIEAYGIEYASKQCEELLAQGIPGIHFYTLNKSLATRQIYKNLGLAKV